MQVLVVDDNRRIADLLRRIALDCGFEAEAATNANYFLQQYETQEPDLILLDVFMPEMDGFDVLRLLRDRQCKSYIVIVSGDAEFCTMASQMAGILGLNIIGAITKPFRTQDVKELLEHIRISGSNLPNEGVVHIVNSKG